MKETIFYAVLMSVVLISGCSSPVLKAPCPNYGSSCSKTPINSWDYEQH